MVVQRPEISGQLRGLLNELQTINLNHKAAENVNDTKNLSISSEANRSEAQTNTKNEETILDYAEHFRQQYMYLYRDRQPLFLVGENEAGCKKCVCTTLRPSLIQQDDLYDWQGCAEFVSDAILPKMLETCTELPSTLVSPIEVLRRQEGNCFEVAGLLASLLLGAGYDAFVVSGYATRELCLADETRVETAITEENPALEDIDGVWENQVGAEKRKKTRYIIRPSKDLTSKFDRDMEAKRQKKIQDEQQRIVDEALVKQAEAERPPEDDLYGVRIHAWVLVRSGRREVPKTFFIDPFSGKSYAQDSDELLGIESIYNHKNYYVCMQDCSEGCVNLSWDVNDPLYWEALLPHKNEELVTRKDPNEVDEEEEDEDSEDDNEGQKVAKTKAIQMPHSWVSEVIVTRDMYETRCPSGKRTFYFKRAKLDKYAPYLRTDGMTQQLSLYQTLDYHVSDNGVMAQPTQIREWFENRVDVMNFRIHDKNTDWICECFQKGRVSYALRRHRFNLLTPQPSAPRCLHYYHAARSDGLFSREILSKTLIEKYIGRDDRLILRIVEYENEYNKPVKQFMPAQADLSQHRPIVQITERFAPSKRDLLVTDPDEISELIYYLDEEKVHVTYHRNNNKISPCTRQFQKPTLGTSMANNSDTALAGTGSIPVWDEDLCQCYSNEIATDKEGMVVAQERKQKEGSPDELHQEDKPSHRILFQQMKDLMQAEILSTQAIRASEEEVADLLKERKKEEMSHELSVSIYDTKRNKKAQQRRQELERQAREDAERRADQSMDYLAPFLSKMGIYDTMKITPEQAEELRRGCLLDMKERLVNKANLIQERFDMETKELERRQAKYQVKQVHITKEEEDEYVNYCADTTFRIHILETRLNEHKKKAPRTFIALEQKIKNDVRLRDLLET